MLAAGARDIAMVRVYEFIKVVRLNCEIQEMAMVITLLSPEARAARDNLDDLLLKSSGHILPRIEAMKNEVENGEGRALVGEGMAVDTDTSLDTTQELEDGGRPGCH